MNNAGPRDGSATRASPLAGFAVFTTKVQYEAAWRSVTSGDFGDSSPGQRARMTILLNEIRRKPILWLLAFVPVLFIVAKVKHDSHTLLFVLSVLAIVPLAALLSLATE